MAHAQQDRHVDRSRPCLLPQVLQQRQGLALGVEDRRAMLQPRDPKSTCPREVLEPIQTEVAQVEQRQRPGRGDLLGDRVGSVAGAPGVIRRWKIEPAKESHSRSIFIAASPAARCRHSRGTGRPVRRAVRWYCCRRCDARELVQQVDGLRPRGQHPETVRSSTARRNPTS